MSESGLACERGARTSATRLSAADAVVLVVIVPRWTNVVKIGLGLLKTGSSGD